MTTIHNYNNVYGQELNINEIEAALHSINSNKAVGFDGITIDIIKYLFKVYPDAIYKLYNTIWLTGFIPDIWKFFRVCLIPKEGKDPTLWDSYRPICINSTWCKVIDKVITTRLNNFLSDNNILNANQHGFRKGHSTLSALTKVKNYIDYNLGNKLLVCMITIDIKNAFGSVRTIDILNVLYRYNIPHRIINFIISYLSNRKVIVDENSSVLNNIGVSQGSSIGPIIWLLLINVLLDK